MFSSPRAARSPPLPHPFISPFRVCSGRLRPASPCAGPLLPPKARLTPPLRSALPLRLFVKSAPFCCAWGLPLCPGAFPAAETSNSPCYKKTHKQNSHTHGPTPRRPCPVSRLPFSAKVLEQRVAGSPRLAWGALSPPPVMLPSSPLRRVSPGCRRHLYVVGLGVPSSSHPPHCLGGLNAPNFSPVFEAPSSLGFMAGSSF